MYFTILLILILLITIFKTEIIKILINFKTCKKSTILNLIQNLIKESTILNLIQNLIKESTIFNLTYKDLFNFKNILVFSMSTYLFIYTNIYYKLLLLLLLIFKKHINRSFYLINKLKKEDFYLNKMIIF